MQLEGRLPHWVKELYKLNVASHSEQVTVFPVEAWVLQLGISVKHKVESWVFWVPSAQVPHRTLDTVLEE
jgi:hypothetical protein